MGPQNKDRSKSSAAITCIKLMLHVFNFLYLVIGICVLAIGIWTQVELKKYIALTQLYYANTAYIMIGVGILIMLVAVGGFYCTAKDKIAPLYMYAIFISLLAIIQVAAGIAGGATYNTVSSAFLTGLEKSLKNYSYYGNAWDTVQRTFKCCAVNGSSDWLEYTDRGVIPASCYADNKTHPTHHKTTPSESNHTNPKEATTTISPTTANVTDNNSTLPEPTTTPSGNDSAAGNDTATTTAAVSTAGGRKKRDVTVPASTKPYDKGCYTEITDAVQDYLSIIIGVCIGFVLLQVCGAVLACCLAKKTSKNNYEQIY